MTAELVNVLKISNCHSLISILSFILVFLGVLGGLGG
jgi:hypothetical protein